VIRVSDSPSLNPNNSAQFSRAFMRTLSLLFAVALVVPCEKVPTRDPPDLARVFHPIFTRELLEASQLLGLAVNLQNPVKARVLIKVNSSKSAADLARSLHDQPQQWLRLPESQLLLYAQTPEVQRHDSSNLELRFPMPEGSARLLLERLAKTDTPQAVAAY
jgi:hypothetical protein